MKIEKLETSNNKFKYIVVGFILCAVIFILINYLTSRASYRNTESIDLAKGTITYKVPDLNIIAMYKDGKPTDTMPGAGYKIDTEESFCYTTNKDEHEAVKLSINSEGNLVIGNLKKGSKCYLYFVEELSKKTLAKLGELSGSNYTIKTETSFSETSNSTAKEVYKFQDNDGATYAFRGNPDNWVTFAGFTWRIIRINGDGTLRLLYYCGNETCTTSENAVEGVVYNTDYNDNTYVGYYYGIAGSNDYNTTHSNKTPSTIATAVANWYNSNLSQYTNKLSGESGWCNDRTVVQNDVDTGNGTSTTFTGDGTGTQETAYKAFGKFANEDGTAIIPSTPELTCEQNDLYTTKGSKKGNGALDVPIGLITADEATIGGLLYGVSEEGSYVSSGSPGYWTMTPYGYDSIISTMDVSNTGVGPWFPISEEGMRPVINVAPDKVKITGILEYTSGLFLLKVFKMRLWDYTGRLNTLRRI